MGLFGFGRKKPTQNNPTHKATLHAQANQPSPAAADTYCLAVTVSTSSDGKATRIESPDFLLELPFRWEQAASADSLEFHNRSLSEQLIITARRTREQLTLDERRSLVTKITETYRRAMQDTSPGAVQLSPLDQKHEASESEGRFYAQGAGVKAAFAVRYIPDRVLTFSLYRYTDKDFGMPFGTYAGAILDLLKIKPRGGVVAGNAGQFRFNPDDPLMSRFMRSAMAAVQSSGINARPSGEFSLLVGEDSNVELALEPFWARYKEHQNEELFKAVVTLARRLTGGKQQITAEKIFPYLVPQAYLDRMKPASEGMIKPLGHGLYVSLVLALEGMVEVLQPEDLDCLKMTASEAHARALENLMRLAESQEIRFAVIPAGPSGQPFVLVVEHWSAAASVLLPGLKRFLPDCPGSLLASVPHRDAMLLFPMGDRAHRDAMRALIRKNESDGLKPLTFELFLVNDAGIKPFTESAAE